MKTQLDVTHYNTVGIFQRKPSVDRCPIQISSITAPQVLDEIISVTLENLRVTPTDGDIV